VGEGQFSYCPAACEADKGGVHTGKNTLSEPFSALRGRHRRLCAGAEQGFTLVELLIAMVLSLVVVGACSDFVSVSLRGANAASSRTVAARQAEVVLARLTRELRQAQYVRNTSGADTTPVNVTYGNGSSSVSFYLPNAGSSGKGTQITWSCTPNGSCTRTAAGGKAVTELSGVESASFTPYGTSGAKLASGAGSAANPEYPSTVQLTLSVLDVSQQDSSQSRAVSGVANAITVQDGVSLRNYLS
jgi:prepilin-type N-terminal cleavage/methylation domain-containing protein